MVGGRESGRGYSGGREVGGRCEMMVIDCCLMPPACIILCLCQSCNTQLPISVLLSGIAAWDTPCGWGAGPWGAVAPCIGRGTTLGK